MIFQFDDHTNLMAFIRFSGMTPLQICSLKGLTSCAELLLIMHADINLRDQISGKTALFHAAERQDCKYYFLFL